MLQTNQGCSGVHHQPTQKPCSGTICCLPWTDWDWWGSCGRPKYLLHLANALAAYYKAVTNAEAALRHFPP